MQVNYFYMFSPYRVINFNSNCKLVIIFVIILVSHDNCLLKELDLCKLFVLIVENYPKSSSSCLHFHLLNKDIIYQRNGVSVRNLLYTHYHQNYCVSLNRKEFL